MKKTFYYLLPALLFLTACSNKKTGKENLSTDIIHEETTLPKVKNIRPSQTTIPLFDKIDRYTNNLSEYVEEIRFIPLSNEPPLRDFQICDIQQSNDYIFLQAFYYVYQYDKQGNFIRQIGNKGQGPKEYTQLSSGMMMDTVNSLLYLSDVGAGKRLVFDFNGNYHRKIAMKNGDEYAALLDSSTWAILCPDYQRFTPYKTHMLKLQDNNGKELKSYKSNLYPYPENEKEHYGPQVNPFWQCGDNFYMMEYGNDTIYEVTKEALVPSLILSGELALNRKELFSKEIGEKKIISGVMMHPNSYIFESPRYLVARMNSFQAKNGSYFAILDKHTGVISRTGNYDSSYLEGLRYQNRVDFFLDDLVSGITVNPMFYSAGEAIALISTESIIKNRERILTYISQHPHKESENLKAIIEKMTDDDNSILCFMRFK